MTEKNEIRTQAISLVIEKMHKKGRVTKKDVRDMLLVSNAEATRYLNELERLGTIKKKQTPSGRTQYILDTDS
jgi:Mn-dependent DtxR family transcriptional regulator